MSEAWTIPPAWLLQSALGGGLLLLVAWGVMRRSGPPARRHFLGALGASAALLAAGLCLGPRWLVVPLPLPAWQSPAAPVPVVAESESPEIPPEAETEIVLEEVLADSTPLPVVTDEPAGFSASSLAADLPIWLAVAWAAGAALLVGRWLLGYCALARLLRAARPAPPRVEALFASMAGNAHPRPRLLVSPRVSVPFSCGLLRPTVVLSPDLCEADEAILRWVFAHELTHLERRDAWTACLFGLAQAVYFYLPWFWWLRRQVRLCQEYIADAAAARQGGSAEDYAQFLLSLTTKPAVPLGATGVAGHTSDLYRRVAMLLQASNTANQRCGWLWSLAATVGLLALAIFVSGIGLQAEAAQDEQPPPVIEDVVIELAVVPGQKDGKKHVYVITTTKDGKVVKTIVDDGSGKDKKKEGPAGNLPKITLPDLEEIIKKLPPGVSEEQLKQFREQMKKAHQDMQKAMEQLHMQMPRLQGVKHDQESIRKAIEELKARVAKDEKEVKEEVEKANEAFRKAVERQKHFGTWTAVPALQGRLTTLNAPGQGRLGIRVETPSEALAEQLDLPKGQGLVITEVVADSAAAKAGLKANDILLSLAGKTVPNDAEVLIQIVSTLKADTAVDAVVLRKGKRETIKGIQVGAAAGRRTFRLEGVPGAQPVPGQPFQPRIRIQADPATGPAKVLVKPAHADTKSVTITVNRNNDNFTAKHQEGDISVSVTGTVEGGKAKASSIEVDEGRGVTKYQSVDKVPEQHRDKVKRLLDSLESGGGKIEIKTRTVPALPAVPARPATIPPSPTTPAKPAPPATPKRPAGRDVISQPVQNGEGTLRFAGLKLLEDATEPVSEVRPKK